MNKIFEGWRNHLFPPEKMKALIEEIAKERMEICKGCPHYSLNSKKFKIRVDEHCTKCGCVLSLKTKCLSCKCPIDKWSAKMSKKDEQIINNA